MQSVTKPQQFDRAFAPVTFSNIIRANKFALSADLSIGGETYAVSPTRCEVCDEWEPECEHLELVKEYVASRNEYAAYEDYSDSGYRIVISAADDQFNTYADALAVGVQ